MYWYRDGNALSLLPWLLVIFVIWMGGWLIVSHVFRLQKRERLLLGLALGIILYAWLINLLGHFLNPTLVFSLPALIISGFGIFLARRRKEGPLVNWQDWNIWPWLLSGLFLFWLFALLGKGLAIFDEHKNLSLISIIANGDIPPRFFLDYPIKYIYHYGFQLFAASLMRLGGMMPWSAFDVGKAIMWSLSLLLAGLLGQRYVGKKWGALLAAGVLAFASGTRYLLFLLPPALLLKADQAIMLQGTSAFIGKPFSQALSSGWTIDGGPPMDYIFGFLNGIMDPLVMAHQGPNLFSVLIFLAAWLLLTRVKSKWALLVFAIMFSTWALAWEATYALFILGMIIFAIITKFVLTQPFPHFRLGFFAAMLSIPVVIFQGGTITELIREAIFNYESSAGVIPPLLVNGVGAGLPIVSSLSPTHLADFFGFSLRWPPAILSAHLGALSLFSPIEILVALFELGPVILFTPWISKWAWRRAKSGDWPLAVFLLASWIGFLMPIFLRYQADRDISRLSWQAMLTWTIMFALMLTERNFPWPKIVRKAAVLGLSLMLFGGMIIMGTQLTAASSTQLAHRFTELDAALLSKVWGSFSLDDKIFGPLGNSTVITGQLTGQLLNEPEDTSHFWNELSRTPDLESFIDHDFQYLVIDSRQWDDLSPDLQAVYDAECIELYAEVWDNSRVNFRRVLDIQACYP